MKKFLFVIIALFFCLTGCKDNSNNSTDENDYNYSRVSTYNNSSNNVSTNENNTNIDNNNTNTANTTDATDNNALNNNTETDLSTFSTKIYTTNDESRQNNIKITCSKLNGTIVKPGETFSFCNTVGKATPEAGYQKADIYDSNGNVVKGYGGGNCQISSTLYNAVLELPSLTVIERHAHSKKVYYVEEGKDAAVAYGSIDFKFRNDYDYNIKIYCSSTTNRIDVRIVKL